MHTAPEIRHRWTASVTEVAIFAARSGDLSFSLAGRTHAAEGARMHRALAKQRPPEVRSEAIVRKILVRPPVELTISGRIDALVEDDESPIVEEVKTTRLPLDVPHPDEEQHWAQAMIYAWMYAEKNGRQRVTVQVAYHHLDSGEIRHRTAEKTIEELKTEFDRLIDIYLDWMLRVRDFAAQRNACNRVADFPFGSVRSGQLTFMQAVHYAVGREQRVVLEAPTGIGKTVAALFPVVQALAAGRMDRIFFLTARNSGKQAAREVVDHMQRSGVRLKTVFITAKDKVCNRTGTPCDSTACPLALGYYDRINDALGDAFRHDAWTPERIAEIAERHRVCPFEFSLDLARWADLIVCDYNYVFDPRVYLRRFFMETNERYLFLVDEAHNLPDRARDMFSAELDKREVMEVRRALRDRAPQLARRLGAISRAMLAIRKIAQPETGDSQASRYRPIEWSSPEIPEGLIAPIKNFVAECERWLAGDPVIPDKEHVLDFHFSAGAFLQAAERFDERYVTCYEKAGRSETIRLFCLDPSEELRRAFARAKSAVLFSATLAPPDYFIELTGGDALDRFVRLPSPFPPEHLQVEIARNILTTYRHRPRSYEPIAEKIRAFVAARQGNYLVFFPSYEYLNRVADRFAEKAVFEDILVQRSGMNESERRTFLEAFSHDNPRTLVGFAVMGGIFGEGIDLTGERLIGAVVVGVGLPKVCLEQQLIRTFFDGHGRDGFDFAYTYPGFNRVLQAAGRVIRSEFDRGRILLIDRRFGIPKYRDLYPAYWQNITDSV